MKTAKYCMHCGRTLQPKELGEHVRMACPAEDCGFIHWGNPTPVVAAVIASNDRSEVLLVRNVGWPEKTFALVTGFLEQEEHPHEAVVREVLEETQLSAISTRWLGNYGFTQKNQVLLCYEVLVDLHEEIVLNEELEEYRWFKSEKLKAWKDGTGLAVQRWIDIHANS